MLPAFRRYHPDHASRWCWQLGAGRRGGGVSPIASPTVITLQVFFYLNTFLLTSNSQSLFAGTKGSHLLQVLLVFFKKKLIYLAALGFSGGT